jgi:large subunit ribosomal protein L17
MHRHAYKGRKLNREKGPRELLLRNLATSIILHERVHTTEAKAKEVRPLVEKMITLGKKGDLTARRRFQSFFLDQNAVEKILRELASLYEKRQGGYCIIIKAGNRVGDYASMAFIQLLDTEKIVPQEKEEKKKEPAKKTTGAAKKDKKEDKSEKNK